MLQAWGFPEPPPPLHRTHQARDLQVCNTLKYFLLIFLQFVLVLMVCSGFICFHGHVQFYFGFLVVSLILLGSIYGTSTTPTPTHQARDLQVCKTSEYVLLFFPLVFLGFYWCLLCFQWFCFNENPFDWFNKNQISPFQNIKTNLLQIILLTIIETFDKSKC